jgi:hypothetical protein
MDIPMVIGYRPAQAALPQNGHGNGDAWTQLRRIIGARPSGIVQFPTRRSRVDELKPGEKLLLIRKYGGLGDILISSMLFPMLADQYPAIRVSYACPLRYHSLFQGSGLHLVPYESVWDGAGEYHRGSVRPEILERYDLVEDISIPCHVWENFFVAYGGIDGGNGLKWRNRLDMWARWFGLRVVNPRTNIAIRDAEKAAAGQLLAQAVRSDRPICILAPWSVNHRKNYGWFEELAEQLRKDRWAVVLLHDRRFPVAVPMVTGLSYRMMGAVCALADMIVSIDTAAFHWGGILGRPTIGIFNVNGGAAYCRYYPTARAVQTCAQPCINVRYGEGDGTCPHHTREELQAGPGLGILPSRCYHRSSVDFILEATREFARRDV